MDKEGKIKLTKNVVVVESPAKAKTINKYLGNDYVVIASYGHVRDLPAKNGSVLPDNQFSMIWETDNRGEKQINEMFHCLEFEASKIIILNSYT